MRPFVISAIIFLALFAGCQKSRDYNTWDQEEFVVIQALIRELNGDALSNGMIADFTGTTIQGPKITEPIHNHGMLGEPWSPKGLVEDFVRANAQPLEIPDSFVAAAQCRKINEAEMKDLFGDKTKGWDEFYRLKTKSLGIHGFSRVGFSSDKSTALVYYNYQWHWLAGQGSYFVLVRKGKSWVIAPVRVGPMRIS